MAILAVLFTVQAPARADVIDDFLGGGTPLTTPPWFDLTPSFHGSLNWGRDYINLTPNPDPDNLHAYDFTAGFTVTRTRIIEAGIGPTFDWNFLDVGAGIVPFVGILPMVGTRAIESRYVRTEEEGKKLPAMRASIVPRYLKTWRAGDHVTYQASGGILFSAGLSFYGFGASSRYLAKGDWVVYVEKLKGSEAYVKITKTALHSFSLNAGAAIVGVSAEWFRNSDNYFSFVVNLDHDHAVKAFVDLLQGNLTEAQRIAEQENSPIRLDTSARVEQTGRRTRFWYGISSVLGGEIQTGKLTTTENEWHHDRDIKVKVNHGVWFKESMARVFLQKERQIEAFYATAHTFEAVEGASAEPFRNYTGTFYFTYENNRTDTGELADALRYLAKRTGLTRELALGMPSQKKLKSTLTQFSLVFSKDATDALMRLAWDRELHRLDGASRDTIDGYFAQGDPDRICGRRSVQRCKEKFVDDTAKAVAGMKQALQQMARFADFSAKDFVRAYAEFGKAMKENRFTIQAALAIADGMPVSVNLSIEGPKVDRFVRKIGMNAEADRSRQEFIDWRIRQVIQRK